MGIHKLGFRPQTSIVEWVYGPQGNILFIKQNVTRVLDTYISCAGGATQPSGDMMIPYDKCIHLRTASTRSGTPEGRSLLRSCYRAWCMLRQLEESEALSVDRDLNGLPVVTIPASYLTSSDPEMQAVVANYRDMVSGIRVNRQAGLVLPLTHTEMRTELLPQCLVLT